ncbi:MAG: hypothetical protein ACMUJM_25540 [bacterium]
MKGLKIILWICAICCLLSFIFAALPWRAIATWFHWVGIQSPAAEAITVFMLRLSLVIFGIIGVFFAILARNPLKYGVMLPLAAYGLVGYGIFSLVAGMRYGLPVWAYSGDVIFGVVAGVLVLIFRKKAIQTNSA